KISEVTMGRWSGYGRQTVEASPCIEISALRRAGYIGKVPGNWWVHRERLWRKGIQPNHWTDSFVSLDAESLQVTWSPWHFGGCRAYFLCACGRTVEKLYAPVVGCGGAGIAMISVMRAARPRRITVNSSRRRRSGSGWPAVEICWSNFRRSQRECTGGAITA